MSSSFLTVLRQSGGKVMLTGALVIGVLVIIGYIGNSVDFEEQFRGLPFSSNPQTPWHQGPAGFIVLGAGVICIGCPRQVVSFFAAYFFGLWVGVGVALAAAVLACVICFTVSRTFQATFR